MQSDRPGGDLPSTVAPLPGGSSDHREHFDPLAEWLEADGLGGFASGTVSGIRTRRYHAALLSARRPPTGRLVLVNGFDAVARTDRDEIALSSQAYAPGVTTPDGRDRLEAFGLDPWPTWEYRLAGDLTLRQELFAVKHRAITVLRFSLTSARARVALEVRPFLSGRDYHALHHENAAFRFDAVVDGQWVGLRPYPDLPQIRILSNGSYRHEPHWYRNFLYQRERERGLDYIEDLAAPGLFDFDLAAGPALLILVSSLSDTDGLAGSAEEWVAALSTQEERRRATFPSRLHRSADDFLVRRDAGTTIVAGYPWFTDWGRDTFISMRGLCLAAGRLREARDILLRWSAEVQEGMLPNFFPDAEREPEYNTVDASLWFVIAAYELIDRTKRSGEPLDGEAQRRLWLAIEEVLTGYTEGARFGIGVDPVDGLLWAGEAGLQLTWMDARVDGRVITPRIGKPVEVEALWLNALQIGSLRSKRWKLQLDRARAAFEERFWNVGRGCLFDVVDVDHRRGEVDDSLRPNQLLAVGGLPFSLLTGERARSVVDCAERALLTPIGVRTLAPGEPGYTEHYLGGPAQRDGAYHQGTAWPWLLGPFVEAWVRARGSTPVAKLEAYRRFVAPLEGAILRRGGLGHISEIADAEQPFTLRGCPFQAWSLGELMRLKLDVLQSTQEDSNHD